MKDFFKNSPRGTIRTSPTIYTMSYDIFSVYGIPISNFLDRQAIGLALNDDKLKSEVWCEIQAKEKEVAFYNEQKRILDKKIEKAKQKIDELKQEVTNEARKELKRNMQKAVGKLMEYVKAQNDKKDGWAKNGLTYHIIKMPIDKVLIICANNNVTPQMALSQMDSTVLERYFDEKCKKYVK